MHGRQLVTRLGMAASPGSRGPVTAARSAAGTTPTGSQAPWGARAWLEPMGAFACRLEGDRPVEDDGRYGAGICRGELTTAPGRARKRSGASGDLEGRVDAQAVYGAVLVV